MRKLFLIAATALLGFGGAAADLSGEQWKLVLGTEFPGAKGSLTRNAANELVLDSDFSGGGDYTGLALALKPPLDPAALEFEVLTRARSVGVQVVDSAGQTFVTFHRLAGNPALAQKVRVEEFYTPGRNGSAKWGGPDDGVIRPPFRSLMLRIIKSNYPAKGPKRAVFRSITAEVPEPGGVIVAPKPGQWKLTLGPEFPGAAGTLIPLAEGFRIDSDFTGGGDYIGGVLPYPKGITAESMSFDVRTPYPSLLVEVTDRDGQTIYQGIRLSGKSDELQHIEVTSFSGPKFGRWGGANDGMARLPLRTIRLRWLAATKPELKRFPVEVTNVKLRAKSVPPDPVRIETSDPAALFVAPGTPSVTLTLDREPENAALDYVWTGCDGRKVAAGKAAVRDRRLILPLPQKQGFYEFTFPALKFTGGVTVLPPYSGERDPFFAMDAACSVFGLYRDEALASAYFRILGYGGVSVIRERLLWGRLEPGEPGKYQWQFRGNAETLRKLAAEHELKVLELFHDAPASLGAVSDRRESGYYPFPRNLVGTAESWRAIGKRWSPYWNALEVWNEPEISFGGELPGDQLGSLQRTVSYAFASNGIDTPLVGGVFTGFLLNERMMRLYLGNGLLDDSDIASFHSYQAAPQLEARIAEFRELLGKEPKAAMPVWITECGRAWPRGTDRATPADDLASARHIVMKAVEAKACGVAMYFPFVLQYYPETSNNFGMMDRNHTPMRSLAGYFNAIRLLSNFRYAGDLRGVSGAELARVFRRGDEAVAVLFGDGPVTLPAGLRVERFEGIDGRTLAPAPSFRPPEGLFYAVTTADAVAPFLRTETEAMRLLKLADSYRPLPRTAKPVVMQYDFDRPTTSWTLYGYMYEDPAHAKFPILLNNLSSEPQSVELSVELPPGAKLLSAAPANITLPPRCATPYVFTADLTGAFAAAPEASVRLRDASGRAGELLIGVRRWNFEKAAALPGPDDSVPGSVASAGEGWIRLDDLTRWKKWKGGHVPNIRAAFRAGYSPRTLRITVLVEDPKFHQPYSADRAWQADSVQLALQTLSADNRRKPAFTEITAAQTPKGPALWLHSREDQAAANRPLTASKLAFTRTPRGMVYRIDLDAKELGIGEFRPGAGFGFTLLVNSSEGKGRDGYLYWGDGIGESKNAREFNRLDLR
ncbi:MAG: hypothetical protein HPZ91_18150 [Lentisphaeria bacterium]|nr:hypothetical protein [Lentisphaeria bacterium]